MKIQERNNRYVFVKSRKKSRNDWNGVPATKRVNFTEPSLYESLFVSFLWHIVLALLVWGLSFALLFFGITPKLFPQPKQKVKNIEFVLKNHHQHRIRHLDVKPIQSAKKAESSAAAYAPKSETPKVQPSPAPKTEEHKSIFSGFGKKSQTKPSGKVSGNTTGKSVGKAHKSMGGVKSASSGGVPSFSMSKINSMGSGIGGNGSSGRSRHHAAGFDASSAGVNGVDTGSSNGRGTSGHSGFDRNTTKKIITTFDISPYVSEMKRNIRWHWRAPKSGSKRVELFLRISKDGRIIILNVKKSSEVGDVDNAALSAVRNSAPFSPIPAKYSKRYLDVIFTFDSGSISSRY